MYVQDFRGRAAVCKRLQTGHSRSESGKVLRPGQFIILRVDEHGERIPLTICDYDREAGTVTIVFQPIGVSTNKLVALKAGDSIADFVGPLGTSV